MTRNLNATQHSDHHGTFEKLIAESERLAGEVMNPGLIEAGWMGGWLTLVRPIVVLQGRLLAAVVSDGSLSLEERGHVHYMRRGVCGDRRVAWVIDLVTESGLPKYLNGVSRTLEQVRSYCATNRQRVQAAFECKSTRQLSLTVPAAVR